MPPVRLFDYEDPYTGKRFLGNESPASCSQILPSLRELADKDIIEIIDRNMEAAREGDTLSAVEALMTLAHVWRQRKEILRIASKSGGDRFSPKNSHDFLHPANYIFFVDKSLC